MDAGIKKWLHKKKRLTFLTLTSSPNSPENISDSAYSLLKKLKVLYPHWGHWNYIRIRTNEGHGVLHVIATLPYIPQRILSRIWQQVHRAPVVDLRRLWYGRGLKNYLTRYLEHQGRLSYSRDWVFQGWRKEFKRIKRLYWYFYRLGNPCNRFCLFAYVNKLYTIYGEDMLLQSIERLKIPSNLNYVTTIQ